MTTARKNIVNPDTTRWYHCISRTVRGYHLLGDPQAPQEGRIDRKQWLEDRLEFLSEYFAISVGGFAILDNHLHVIVRLDPHEADAWTPQEVVRRCSKLWLPPKGVRNDPKKLERWIESKATDEGWVANMRERLKDLGWFMKQLKEPFARLANREDETRGTYWNARYQSIAILDTAALLATHIYVDLNVFAAGLASVPEESPHTSIKQRVEKVKDEDNLDKILAAEKGSVPASRAAGNLEEDQWMVPLEDRRPHTGAVPSSPREGVLESLTLGNYLLLLDLTSRLARTGKAQLSAGVAGILERLQTDVETLVGTVQQMLKSDRLRGCFFAMDPEKLRQHSQSTGKRRVNLSPQPSPG